MDRSHVHAFIASSPIPPFPTVQKGEPAEDVKLTKRFINSGSEARRKIHARAANGQMSFAQAAKNYFFWGELVAQRKLQKCSGIRDSFHVSSRIASGVDPAGVHSYNRPSVMDGKASFL
jgi:hypothetical protein